MTELRPVHRLFICIGISVVATLMLIQIASWPIPLPTKVVAVVSYLALVPSIVFTVTLWEEVRASVSRVFLKPPGAPRRKPMYLSSLTTSSTLYTLSRSLLRDVVGKYGEALSKLYVSADLAVDPYNTAALSFIAFLVSIVAIPTILVLLGQPIGLAALVGLVVAAIALASPYIVGYAYLASRRSGVEVETPFFALYATLVERAGKSLVTAFERVAEQIHVFKRIALEALTLRKLLAFFRYSPMDALIEYAQNVPSPSMSRLVSGYVGIVRIGGDTASYLESVYRSMLEELAERWRRYTESASFMGEVVLALFMLFPSMLTLGAIAFSQFLSVRMLDIFTYFVAPLVGIAIYLVTDSTQPKMPSNPLFTPIDRVIMAIGIPVTIAVAMAMYRAVPWIRPEAVACIAIATAMLPQIAIYLARTMEVRAIETDLPLFLRDLAEFVRIGYSVPRAITFIARTRRYNRFLDNYVRALSMLLQLNIPLQRIQRSFYTRSWLFNYTLFVISDLEYLGALTPHELDRLSSFVETVVRRRDEARKGLTLYVALAIITPLFIVLLAILSSSLITLSVGTTLPGAIQVLSKQMIQLVVNRITMLSIVVAIVMGITAAKVRDGTGLNTTYTLISLTTLALTLAFWPQVQSLVAHTLTSIAR